jgi:DNA-directed RNA polymerase specialized sigma24 family protein
MTHVSAPREFPVTSWTLLAAASESGAAAEQAVAEFTARYYGAVTAFIRVIVRDDDLAQDLTHEFFQERILRAGGVLVRASAKKGRFRPFLKQSIRNFLIDKHRSRAHQMVSTGSTSADDHDWSQSLADDGPLAEEELLRDWGRSLVNTAIAQVKQSCEARGQHHHFAMFAMRYLSNPDDPPGFREVGRMFDMDEKKARGCVETVANRFRAVLEELVMTDAGASADFRRELLNLIALL